MKRTCLHLSKSSCFYAIVGIITCALLSFSATTAVAQGNASVAPMPPISTEDLPHELEWKNAVDYAAVLASERANTAVTLAGPNIKEIALGVYTGYDRMLAYMQQDLIDNVAIEKIAEKNYNKVLAETPSDPILVNMESTEFDALYVALLAMLHQ